MKLPIQLLLLQSAPEAPIMAQNIPSIIIDWHADLSSETLPIRTARYSLLRALNDQTFD